MQGGEGASLLGGALMVLANGMVMDRDMVVSALSESPPWRTYDIGARLHDGTPRIVSRAAEL